MEWLIPRPYAEGLRSLLPNIAPRDDGRVSVQSPASPCIVCYVLVLSASPFC